MLLNQEYVDHSKDWYETKPRTIVNLLPNRVDQVSSSQIGYNFSWEDNQRIVEDIPGEVFDSVVYELSVKP